MTPTVSDSWPPLLVIPGLGLGEEAVRPMLRACPGVARIAPLAGYGVAAQSGHDLRPSALAGEVDLTDVPGVVLLGHSASCQVVAHVGRTAGRRIGALVLVGPTTDPEAATWPRLGLRWLRTAVAEDPRQLPLLLRLWSHTGFVTMFRAMDAARHDRIDRVLAEIEAPVLIIRGARDQICNRDWVRRLVDGRRNAGATTAVTLPTGSHMVPLTHGPQAAAAIRRFYVRSTTTGA